MNLTLGVGVRSNQLFAQRDVTTRKRPTLGGELLIRCLDAIKSVVLSRVTVCKEKITVRVLHATASIEMCRSRTNNKGITDNSHTF